MDNPGITPNSLKQDKVTTVSYYKAVTGKTNSPIEISEAFQLIRTGKGFKKDIEELRKETNKAKANIIKKNYQPLPFPPYLMGKEK